MSVVCGLLTIRCQRNSEIWNQLDMADAFMEEHPDSSLSILSAIPADKLSGDEEHARHALLLSMALDKNYVDTTTFVILQPAIDYYLKKGTPDMRMKTLYYLGRIYQNQGEYEKADQAFFNAIELNGEIIDSLTLARTYAAIGHSLHHQRGITEYIKFYSKAADIYKRIGHNVQYYDCLFNILNGYILLDDKLKADSIILLCSEGYQERYIDSQLLRNYHLSYIIKFRLFSQLDSIINICMNNHTHSADELLTIAHGCLEMGDNKKAAEILEEVRTSNLDYDMLKYRSLMVDLHRSIGNYKEAFNECLLFYHTNDSLNQIKFRKAIKESMEYHEFKIKALSDSQFKTGIIMISILTLFLLLMIVMILVYSRRINKAEKHRLAMSNQMMELEHNLIMEAARTSESEKERLQLEPKRHILESENMRLRLTEISSEIEYLKQLNTVNNGTMPQEVREVIQKRIIMLNTFFALRVSANTSCCDAYEEWISNLISDKNVFLNENMLAIQACFPAFINHLKNHELDDDEIEYVCLYAIGLKGIDISRYLNSSSHVHVSSAVRKKLGLGKHDTNLGIFVKKLMEELK